MAEIVNLKLHRKRKARVSKEAEAEQNRITHGRTRTERELTEARNQKAKKDLDAQKREE